MELLRQKNQATIIAFPIMNISGEVVVSAADLDSEIDTWSNTVAPNGFDDCTNEATEIGSSGVYYLSLTQAEMNNDYLYLKIGSSTEGAISQHILIRTMEGDPLDIATTLSGEVIDVSDIATQDLLLTLSGEISSISTETDKIQYILGLSQENFRIYNQVYDSGGNMTGASVSIYPTATDADNDTNPIATYTIAATFSGVECTEYKVTKD